MKPANYLILATALSLWKIWRLARSTSRQSPQKRLSIWHCSRNIWFRSTSLYGPWAFVSPGSLPADFQKIPSDHPKSNVLASVPGTPQASEAAIASTIPQTATVDRSKAKLTVNYEGAPTFAPIPGTTLQYATNSATPVIMVNASTGADTDLSTVGITPM